MKLNILPFLFLVLHNFISSTHFKVQPAWDNKLNLKEIEYLLSNDPINKIEIFNPNAQENKKVYLVELKSGLKGIFKARIKLHNCAEVAIYRISKFLNLKLVPPTILRKINGREGTLQFFVNGFSSSKFFQLDSRQKSDTLLFNFVFGRIDWHGNIIVQNNKNKYNVALIDNACCGIIQKIKYGQLPFFRIEDLPLKPIKAGVKFPFGQAKIFNTKAIQSNSILEGYKGLLNHSWFFAYLIFNDEVWFVPDPKKFMTSFSKFFQASTLVQYRKLNKSLLNLARQFEDMSGLNKEYLNQLFDEVIDRKNQILLFARNAGIIIS